MKQKVLIPIIALIILLWVASFASARMVHDFDCNNCHKPGMDLASVSGIVCLDCHTSGMVGSTFPLHRNGPGNTNPVSNSTFAVGDASDSMGAVTGQGETPGDQTSHNWAALLENAAAGADRPSSSVFYGRQNSSGSYLTCSRCHDPHGSLIATSRSAANPKLLKLGPDTESAMCNDCHVDWASDTASSENGGTAPTNVHPMVNNYAAIATAKATEYNSVVELNAAAGEVALNGTGGIDCLTCHGVHWTDSDATTTDGAGQALSIGDGQILRANGASVDQANVPGASLCQSCHKYKDHGTGRTNPIGCLVCHGAHLEDTGGSMNNYMLRTAITTYLPKDAGSGSVSGLALNVSTAQNTRLWDYCFNCHNSADAVAGHVATWDCTACHSHDNSDGSWTAAGGCNTCHGYPPSVDLKSDGAGGNAGYADGYELTTHFKDEGQTLHSVHAGGGDYTFSCNACHAGNSHIDGSFDDVFIATSNQLYNGNGLLTGGNAPAYDPAGGAGAGSCSNVYCHSNGGPRGTTPTANDPAVWEGGAVTNACDICHGNDVTDMATRSNSATHLAHLNKGYSCQVCHVDTADSATLLASGAIGGTHVDGTADVAFDATSLSFALGSTSYGTSDGTCSVYCHSNGTANVSPDWDLAGSGACGSCHQYSNAGVATGTGAALGGAHTVHVFAASGPQLACSTCHTHDGATGVANSDHVNGAVDKVTNYMDAVCNPCHGSTNGGIGDDAEPVWATPSSVTCETCHAGNVIATINSAAPAKTDYDAAGHGTKLTTPQFCTTCHSVLEDNNHLGALGDTDRLNMILGVTYNPTDSKPFCSLCHSGEDNHYGNANSAGATDTSTDGNNCVICHDPHGQLDKNSAALDAMLRATIGGRAVTGFSDKNDRTTYYNTVDVGEGVCQTCHDPNEVNNFNRTTANTSHGGSGTCISCHPHTTTPAFKASCNGCHGDESTGQYWPYGSGGIIPTANDEVGEHTVHVLALSQQLGYGDIATLLAAADTDSKQKAICEYCHAATTNDDDHGLVASLDADVFVASGGSRHAKSLWNAADTDAAYNNAADTCSNIDCHNSKLTVDNSYGWYDGASDPGCILCHNDVTSTGIATGQTHAAHTGAATLYGVTINCASCHDSTTNWSTKTKPANNHIDGTFDMGGTFALSYDGTFGTSFGSCGTNNCHEDGRGNAPAAYTWGTAGSSDCGICHAATPNTGDHAVHLSATHGPNLGADCSGCHVANSNNTSMASLTTHLNGTVTLNNVAVSATPYEVASGQIGLVGNDAVDSCDLCHGGNTAANLAKDYWTTADPVSCESCHGDYTPAEIGGVVAPSRAGSAYDSWGHGRSVGANSHNPNQLCAACHAEASAHISGGLGQNRLDNSPNNNFDYSVDGERNDFCNDCHTTAGAMNVHFGDANTVGGGSTDGLYCVTCHDPHGQDGFDAMVKADVGGNTVAGGDLADGFTDRTDRTKYRDASFTGVCQTCHADSEVGQFNQSTDNNAGHNPGANCLACHPHSAAPAFKASCNGCHGDGSTGQYWPDGDTDTQIDAANDDAGRHDAHILLISQQLGYGNIAALLADADTDSKQKAICTYCHAVNDDDHGLEASLPAEVFDATVGTVATDVAKAIWDGSIDTNAVFTKAGGSCATVDCHNNKTTTATGPNDYTWDGADTSNCVMCHVDVPSDTASHSIHTAAGTWAFSCSECHAGTPAWGDTADTGTQTAPSSGHMNGTYSISGGSRSFTYNSGTGSCGVNECHNDGTSNAADVSGYNWSAGATVGLCAACHGYVVATNNHPVHTSAHNTTGGTAQFVSSAIDCDDCHTNQGYFSGTTADHLNSSVSFKAGITYSASTAVSDGGVFGTCSTLLCHSDGRGNKVDTPAWDRAATTSDDCRICHLDRAPGMSNAHDEHTGSNGATAYVSGNSNQSTNSEYRFDCGLCHGNTIGNHIDGDADLLAGVNWSDGTNTCSTNDCHQDGQGGAPVENPNWVSGFTVGDACAKCHANSPTSNAHHEHEVGFHYDAVYSGLSGFLPVEDADYATMDAGLDATYPDQLRGHGGNINGAGTSTATTITCYVCHYETVRNWYNANNVTCSGCHTAVASPSAGDMAVGNAALTIYDKSKHVQPGSGAPIQVSFFNQIVRSKAQLRDDLADVAEISNNWTRINGYKLNDGTSYDEQPDTLDNLSTWNSADKTCTTSCHLWEENRVDKLPVAWDGGAVMCIDCHTRLPK